MERGRDTERFHEFASRMLLFALALLAPGFCGDLYVVLYRAGHANAALPVAAAATSHINARKPAGTRATRKSVSIPCAA